MMKQFFIAIIVFTVMTVCTATAVFFSWIPTFLPSLSKFLFDLRSRRNKYVFILLLLKIIPQAHSYSALFSSKQYF